MADSKKPWGGRFDKSPGRFLDEFGASLPVDRRMWAEDIRGSIAHARMLAKQGIISDADADAIEGGLSEIYREIREGRFEFDIADEDVHMAIERALTERIGSAGARLHTARSRNDQVATDTRLYVKGAITALAERLTGLRETLVRRAEELLGIVMPGYTHLQRAQPVLVSHHLLAYAWMLTRDVTRLRHAWESADVLPLGSAALAGTTFDIDRRYVADRLGFAHVSPNSLDAVSDRDFVLDLVYACTVAMIHLSRLAEELVLWSTEEFGFVAFVDSHATGSSIMPQKKNPDFAELVRGKTGRVVGDLVALVTTLKALPLAYNKDMQEDKEAAFDAIDTLSGCVLAMDGMIGTLQFREDRMAEAARGGFMAATDLADHLAEQGVPFRKAHEIVGALVLECEKEGRTLQDLTMQDLRAASDRFGVDGLDAVDIAKVVERRASEGGTAGVAVGRQLVQMRDVLTADRAWLESLGG